ncbi:TNF receptor-associated factor 5-like [Stylophora pistillata]|uniref:TNF receptor-associated factor 5-like n=1 Tax=Stylophora pistillata TaxID=50429 RepID=UPI000C04AA79|nr:TNF receptor-associated factor 5-like [Stylophora pistillata]
MNARDAFFITEITEVRQHRHIDSNEGTTAVFTCPMKTDRYGYKLGLRMYLNGVGNGRGRSVAIFLHMRMGKYDNFEVRWPFTQRITLSIIDQSGAERHLSRILQAKPNMVAFQKPTQMISRTGCGFVNFAPIEEVFSDPYVKDDTLFLKIEFSA